MSKNFDRKNFMSASDKEAMGNFPRTHQNCFKLTKKNRPGKTACERARRVTDSQLIHCNKN